MAWHEDSVCSSSGECLECYQHMNPQREVDYASEVCNIADVILERFQWHIPLTVELILV